MVPLKITLPEHFLDEEERCGYVVSHEMKKVWAVMLDLLAEFDRVCKKNNLKYQASWGTLLGAVRHKGFIPWDDDMDVQMFREDYDKLCTIGPSEFRHPYFFQSKKTDPGANTFFCKLRNSETTALSSSETNSITDYNKGIFIDIFPIDRIPDNQGDRENFFNAIKAERLAVIAEGRKIGVFSETQNIIQHFVKKVLYRILVKRRKCNLSDFVNSYEKLNELCGKYNQTQTEQLAMLTYFPPDANIMFYSDYKDTVLMDFEFLKIPVAKGYDHALKVLYGDYTKFYIKEAHSAFYDTGKSYIFYTGK